MRAHVAIPNLFQITIGRTHNADAANATSSGIQLHEKRGYCTRRGSDMKKMVAVCGLLVVACVGLLVAQTASVDLLIRGGTVMDGTGSEPVVADVGIKADRIEFIGDSRAARVTATRTIDA